MALSQYAQPFRAAPPLRGMQRPRPRGLSRCGCRSDHWLQNIDHVATTVELDGRPMKSQTGRCVLEALGVAGDEVRKYALDGLTRRLAVIGVPLTNE